MHHQAAGPVDGPAFGFLTVHESAAHGVFGGYLVVDALGRPLEFHCTAPVRVSRAQQILYGPTLAGYLHGRQIGGALLSEAGLAPAVVFTDEPSVLEVRPHTRLPVALVRRSDAEQADGGFRGTAFTLGDAEVIPPPDDPVGREAIRAGLAELADTVDLCEPFDRIRAAIDEAQRH